MSITYQLAYRFGFTPWEDKDPASLRQLSALLDREERDLAAPFGRALDIGCGTGGPSIELARRGWEVTGVDAVRRALRRARDRARAAGVTVTFVQGDASSLLATVQPGYRFALDVGCFHGLADGQRRAYAEQLREVTEPGSGVLLFAFSPGHRGPLPRGADRAAVEEAFRDWEITHDDPADVTTMTGPAAKASPHWFRLAHN